MKTLVQDALSRFLLSRGVEPELAVCLADALPMQPNNLARFALLNHYLGDPVKAGGLLNDCKLFGGFSML